jgi:uncharacterized damage-inducible protein DinB
MIKSAFQLKLDYFKMVHGITLRAIACFEIALAEAITQGRFTAEVANRWSPESEDAAQELEALATIADVHAYAENCHSGAANIFEALSEEDLARKIESPFGTYPASRYFDFFYDENWHHRGQLYLYLRLLGKEPPILYDY